MRQRCATQTILKTNIAEYIPAFPDVYTPLSILYKKYFINYIDLKKKKNGMPTANPKMRQHNL